MRIALLLFSIGLLAGCGGAGGRWVDDARAAHAQADALLRSGEPERAAQALQDLVSRPAPAEVAQQDRRVVLQDAYARLAELALRRSRPAQALQLAEAGLALGEGRDVFNASLRTLRGRAHEDLGSDAEAARDYEAAQGIAEALLEALRIDGGTR